MLYRFKESRLFMKIQLLALFLSMFASLVQIPPTISEMLSQDTVNRFRNPSSQIVMDQPILLSYDNSEHRLEPPDENNH